MIPLVRVRCQDDGSDKRANDVIHNPYKSEKQRKFMYAKHPKIAKRWAKEGKNYIG